MTTILSSLSAGGFLTMSLFIMTLLVVHAARKKIMDQTRRLKELAGRDPLTGLHNRMCFDTRVPVSV